MIAKCYAGMCMQPILLSRLQKSHWWNP